MKSNLADLSISIYQRIYGSGEYPLSDYNWNRIFSFKVIY